MKMLDLFSGIGGFHLAAEWVWGDELEVVSHCEIDPWATRLLKKHWPNVPVHSDIKTLKGDSFGTVDLLTGGFPCQPFSSAGKQRGAADDRYLWPQMFRVIQEARPAWVIGENVSGLIDTLEFEQCIVDLENQKYEVQAFIVPACAEGANHRRDRVWIIANSVYGSNKHTKRETISAESKKQKSGRGWFSSKAWRDSTPRIYRKNDGVSPEMDRLKGLGNAIVPQVVMPFMQLIKQVEMERKEASACKAVL